jgi:hypothetical protein
MFIDIIESCILSIYKKMKKKTKLCLLRDGKLARMWH